MPAVRQSGGKKSKDLGITKEGSGLLRWALVEAAWRLVATSPEWAALYERLKKRRRQQAGHRGGGAEALVRALRDAQDVDPLQDLPRSASRLTDPQAAGEGARRRPYP